MSLGNLSKKILKWIAVTVSVLVLCLFSLFGIIQTEAGRQALLRQIDRLVDGVDQRIELGKVSGVIPFHFSLDRFAMTDKNGTWFSVEGLEIHWSPLSLLKGNIHFRELRSGSLQLQRIPPGAENKEKSLRLPNWLSGFRRLKVDHLAIDELVFGEPVFGERSSFKLQSDLKAAFPGGEWVTRLRLDRVDGPLARLILNGTVRENGRFLLLEIEGEEGYNGLLSRHSGIEGPIAFSIQGEGPVKEWIGKIDVTAGGAGMLKATVRAAYDEGFSFDMEGLAQKEAGFLHSFLGDVPGSFRFATRGGFGKDGKVLIEHLSMEAGEASLQVSGTISLKDGTLKGHVQVRHEDLGKFGTVTNLPLGGKIRVEGDVSGTVDRPSFLLAFQSIDLMVDKAALSHLNGRIRLDVANGGQGELRLQGEGIARGLSIPETDLIPERDLQWTLLLEWPTSSGPVRLKKLNLKGKRNSLQLAGTIHPSTWTGTFEAEAETGDLGFITRRLGGDLSGNIRIKAAGEGNFKALSLSVEVQGGMKNLETKSLPQSLLRGAIDFTSKFHLERGEKVVVSEMALSNPLAAISAGGNFDLVTGKGLVSARLQVPDLQPLSTFAGVAIGGALQVHIAGEGSAEKMKVQAQGIGNEILIRSMHFGEIKIWIDTVGAPLSNEGSLRFEVGEALGRVSGKSRFALRKENLSLSGILLNSPGSGSARGDLRVDLGTMLAEGKLEGEWTDLEPLSGLIDRAIGGRVDFKAELAKSGKNQQLKTTLTATDLKTPDLAAGRIRIRTTVTDFSAVPMGSAGLEAEDVLLEGVRISSLRLTAQGDGREISFTVNANGENGRRFDLETKGLFFPEFSGPILKVRRLQGRYGELDFRMVDPIVLERSGEEFSLKGLQFVLAQGRLSGEGKIGPGMVDFSLNVKDLPVKVFQDGVTTEMEGTGSGELILKGSPDRPQAAVRARIVDLGVKDTKLKGIPQALLEIQGDFSDERLKCRMVLKGVTSRPFEAVMDIPLRLSLDPLHASFPGEIQLNGSLNGQADLASLGTLFGLHDQSMTGIADVTLRLEGTPEHPVVVGSIGVDKGTYENARSGTILKDVDILLIAGTRGLVIDKARASDGEEGSAVAEGLLEMDPGRGFPFQIDLNFQKSKILRHDWVSAKGNGSVRLKGSFSHAVLSGGVQIESGEFRIPERLPPDMPKVDVLEINGTGPIIGDGLQDGEESTFLDFDLRVKSKGHFFVRGRGLESEWQGELRLTGPVDDPSVTGEFFVERGRFNFFDRRFTLTQGRITFDGSSHSTPFLEVMAQSSTTEMTANLQLIGPVSAPEIKLSSEPPLPSDEVLSHLLFGKGVSRISPLQAVQLARALNMMAGGHSLDFVGTAQKWLRIDQLEVKQSGEKEEQTSISAGKYLRDNVYLEVEQELGPKGTKASVNWGITPHISIETELGANAETGVGVNWKWDY